jgi:hypothetical protein
MVLAARAFSCCPEQASSRRASELRCAGGHVPALARPESRTFDGLRCRCESADCPDAAESLGASNSVGHRSAGEPRIRHRPLYLPFSRALDDQGASLAAVRCPCARRLSNFCQTAMSRESRRSRRSTANRTCRRSIVLSATSSALSRRKSKGGRASQLSSQMEPLLFTRAARAESARVYSH